MMAGNNVTIEISPPESHSSIPSVITVLKDSVQTNNANHSHLSKFTPANGNEHGRYLEMDYTNSLQDRLCYFLENNLGTDLKFIVGDDGGQQEISAHKMMLGSASPVFFSMFYGGMGNENVVTVPDCDPESFRAAIEYIYKGKIPTLTIYDKPSEMLYIARKYHINSLEQECVHQLDEHMNAATVIEIMRLAQIYDLLELQENSWKYIIRNIEEVLESSWKTLDRNLLLSVLRSDQLNISELNLFRRTMEWASDECSRNKLEPTIENLRSTLGEALTLIRFPTMCPEDVAVHVVGTHILTLPQLANIFIAIHSPTLPSHIVTEFSRKPRELLPKCACNIGFNKNRPTCSFFIVHTNGSSSSDNAIERTENSFINNPLLYNNRFVTNRSRRRRAAAAARRASNQQNA